MPDDTLTMDDLAAAIALVSSPPLRTRPRVVVSHHLPRNVIGHWIDPLSAHPLWVWWRRLWGDSGGWLACWIASPMYDESGYQIGDTLLVSPQAFKMMEARDG